MYEKQLKRVNEHFEMHFVICTNPFIKKHFLFMLKRNSHLTLCFSQDVQYFLLHISSI